MLSDYFSLIIGIIGVITGVSGMIVSIRSFYHNRIDALNMYFSYARDSDFIKGRRLVYNLEHNVVIDESCDEIISITLACLMNAYQHWGMLLKHKQLPFWIFYNRKTGVTASGIAVIRTYNKLRPTIDYYRNKNPKYADSYTYLYDRIVKKCPEYKNFE